MNPKWREYLAWCALLALWIVVLLSSRVVRGGAPALNTMQKQALVEAYRAGDHYQLGLEFSAIVYVESRLCANAVRSAAGALGCAQVKPVAAEAVSGMRLPAWQLSDPNMRDVNMAIGARYLDLCLQRFGWPIGAGCYEQGIPRTRILQRKGCFRARAERIKPCREVRRYMAAVLAAMKWLKNLPGSGE